MRRRSDVTGRLLFLGLIALTCLAVWVHRRSLTASTRRDKPIAGILSLRFSGQSKILPPALYFVAYGEKTRSLHLVLIPPSAPLERDGKKNPRTLADVYGETILTSDDTESATKAMGKTALLMLGRLGGKSRWTELKSFWFDVQLPPHARPAFPSELKRRIVEISGNALFWPRMAFNTRRILTHEWTGLGLYDIFMGARKLRGIDPASIHLAKLPEPDLIPSFLKWLHRGVTGDPFEEGPATVEVLNATEVPGVALRATKILRLAGFDVVHFGNTRTMESYLRVVDRAGRHQAARSVLEILGCRGSDVLTAMEPKPRADITVVLGRDFTRCKKLNKP